MNIKATIGSHAPAERANEFVQVIDALIEEENKRTKAAAEKDGPVFVQPNISFAVEAEKVGSVKRQMREAAHLRERTARLTAETAHPSGKKGEPDEIELTYILTDRITRTTADETETATE